MRIDDQLNSPSADVIGVIHNVHILDASGSMAGGKYINALKGINDDLENQRSAPNDGILVTNTVVEFQGDTYLNRKDGGVRRHYFMTPVANCSPVIGVGATGGTPLFQTVGELIEELLRVKKPSDKVILKIFTDGEENSSIGKYKNIGSTFAPKSEELEKLIKDVESNHNFTVTFMGTVRDVENMISNMHLERGNTLSHLNTPESIQTSYTTSNMSTVKYRKALRSGASQDELSRGFFKRVENEENKD